jgi:hypothetical protein
MSGVDSSVGEDATAKLTGTIDEPEKATGASCCVLAPSAGPKVASRPCTTLTLEARQRAHGDGPVVYACAAGPHTPRHADTASTMQQLALKGLSR